MSCLKDTNLQKIFSRMVVSQHGGSDRRLQIYKAIIIILERTNEMMIREEVNQFSRWFRLKDRGQMFFPSSDICPLT
jgi:hypothetical protein